MVTRNRASGNDPSLSEDVREAKISLRDKAWSYRSAAKYLGYSYTHFVYVMTGRRHSITLLAAIEGLPNRKEVEA